MRRRVGMLIVVFALLASAGALSPAAVAASGGAPVTAPTGRTELAPSLSAKNPKADWHVARVAASAAVRGQAAALSEAAANGLAVTGGRVRVVVETNDVVGARQAIGAAGASIEASAGSRVRILATPAQLGSVIAAGAVRYVRAPLQPRPDAIVDEAVATTNASGWHAEGQTGAGVKVAVIDLGFGGYAAAESSGELPATETTMNYCSDGFETYTSHGTAVAEIVHKMAPAAQLYLICIADEIDLANATDYARSQGVVIVNHSVGWYNSSRGDGSGAAGTPDAIVADATADGILWVNAAGNDAQHHWSGSFVDDGTGYNEFATGDTGEDFIVGSGYDACVYLKWDDWPYSDQDFDLEIHRRSDGALVGQSTNPQTGSQTPTEETCFTNNGSSQWFYAAIVKAGATTTPRFDMFIFGAAGGTIQYVTMAGSVAEPASAPAAFAAAAVCWEASVIEPFSSQGPTIDGREKPDISGQDQVSSAVYGSFSSCAGTGFAGTSAAAPHVAGAAALVKGAFASWPMSDIRAYLELNATPLGSANAFGAGLLHLPSVAFVPGKPLNVVAYAYNLSALVSWKAPADGAPATSYTVTATPDGAMCTTTGALSCTVTGLTNGVSYTFVVVGANGEGQGEASDPSAPAIPKAVPDALAAPTATAANATATVSWTAPADNGSPITLYTVTSSPGTKQCTTTTLSCSITGLTNGTKYTFTVKARNANGNGPSSAKSNIVTPAGPPGAPTAVTATAGDTTATVAWSAAPANGSAVTSYVVTSAPDSKQCSTTGALSCAVPGLANGRSYTFTVQAANGVGTGPVSAVSNSVTPAGRPGAPGGVTAAAGDTVARVSWTAAAANGATVTSYTATSTPGSRQCSASSGSTCTVTGLANGTSYTFTVKASNRVGTGPASAVSNAVTPKMAVFRYAGTTRFGTAVNVSKNTFTDVTKVQAVYIANATNFPDALAGAAAAGMVPGPVLLSSQSGPLDAATIGELQRIHPKKIVVLGGTGAIGSAVLNALKSYSGNVTRYSGTTRFGTAADISRKTFTDLTKIDAVYVANAYNFPDALAGAAAAGTVHGPVLLAAQSGALDPATIGELQRIHPKKIVVLGGTGAISDAVLNALKAYSSSVVRYSGTSRFGTAADVSKKTFTDATAVKAVYVADAYNFPDALAGAAAAGTLPGPVLLADPTTGKLDAATIAELTRLHPKKIVVLGGTGVVPAGIFEALRAYTSF